MSEEKVCIPNGTLSPIYYTAFAIWYTTIDWWKAQPELSSLHQSSSFWRGGGSGHAALLPFCLCEASGSAVMGTNWASSRHESASSGGAHLSAFKAPALVQSLCLTRRTLLSTGYSAITAVVKNVMGWAKIPPCLSLSESLSLFLSFSLSLTSPGAVCVKHLRVGMLILGNFFAF